MASQKMMRDLKDATAYRMRDVELHKRMMGWERERDGGPRPDEMARLERRLAEDVADVDLFEDLYRLAAEGVSDYDVAGAARRVLDFDKTADERPTADPLFWMRFYAKRERATRKVEQRNRQEAEVHALRNATRYA